MNGLDHFFKVMVEIEINRGRRYCLKGEGRSDWEK